MPTAEAIRFDTTTISLPAAPKPISTAVAAVGALDARNMICAHVLSVGVAALICSHAPLVKGEPPATVVIAEYATGRPHCMPPRQAPVMALRRQGGGDASIDQHRRKMGFGIDARGRVVAIRRRLDRGPFDIGGIIGRHIIV